jgi:predicted GNAT family N-acyltransferase
MAYRFELLSREHDRAAFRSSSKELNTYLRTLARKDAGRHISAAFVMVDEAAPAMIIGYYTLSAFTIEVTEISEPLQKKLPRYPRLPATLLGRLARDERFPGTGSLLLMNALERAFQQSSQIASLAVVADAKDERALAFYRKFGFEVLASSTNRVFLPMGTIEQMISSSS